MRPPNIYKYYDYRAFLKDLFLFKKKHNGVFSNRYIIKKAGYKSPTAFKHVIDGKRNLSLESAQNFAEAFKIHGKELEYFLKLVLFNQGKSLAEKERHFKELAELQKIESPSLLNKSQYQVLAKWWHLAIREIIALPDAKNSSKWIGKILKPEIAPEEVKKSLRLLKKFGFIKKEKRKWVPIHKTLMTTPQVHSVLAAEFHRQMIDLGKESITGFPTELREISGTTLRVSIEDRNRVADLIRDFRKKILQLATVSKNADQIYQMNFQFFPLVQEKRKRRMK